jgi:uncharacterized membrane protein YedE/YeeE
MKKFIKPASLLFFFLSFIIFFFIGVTFAGLTNAAEGQGLAGGAIVLGYGVIFGFVSFLFALLAVYILPIISIIKFNRFLVVIILIIICALVLRQIIRKNRAPETSHLELRDNNFQAVGNEWIQWKNENRILISYSLLS